MLGADADYLEPDQILSEYTIPFGGDYIVDAGRWIRKPESHDSIEDALCDTAHYYRRALWSNLSEQVHVFARKTPSLTGVSGDGWFRCIARRDAWRFEQDVSVRVRDRDSSPPPSTFSAIMEDKGRDIIRSAVEHISAMHPTRELPGGARDY